MPQISVIVITWNSAAVLGDCLDSLFAHVPEDRFEAILVDNHSRDPAYLDRYGDRKNVRVIRNPDNYGYAKAVNIGARAAAGEYVVVLNPDMVFLSDPFPRLLEEMAKDPAIGAIGPLLQGADGRPQIEDFYPSLPSTLQFILLRSIFKRAPFAMKLAMRFFHSRIGHTGVHAVEQIPGAFLLLRKGLFGDDTVLNEAFFIWMEDVDFCQRLRKMGLKAVVVADERITHLGGTSFAMQSIPWKRLMFTRSYLTYLRLHLPLARLCPACLGARPERLPHRPLLSPDPRPQGPPGGFRAPGPGDQGALDDTPRGRPYRDGQVLRLTASPAPHRLYAALRLRIPGQEAQGGQGLRQDREPGHPVRGEALSRREGQGQGRGAGRQVDEEIGAIVAGHEAAAHQRDSQGVPEHPEEQDVKGPSVAGNRAQSVPEAR